MICRPLLAALRALASPNTLARLGIVTLLGAGIPGTAEAQQARSAISPDTILVGDIFRAAIRIALPAGVTLTAPDSLPTTGEVENAGRMRRTTRELPDGGSEETIVYPVTAWRTGEFELPTITLVLSGPDEIRELSASFPSISVRSVLPTDTAGVEPRPPKDVLGPSRLLWPWIVGALSLIAALGAFVYYRRRSRGRVPGLTFDVAQAGSPKERALAELERVRARGLVEAGQYKEFSSGTPAALRGGPEGDDTAGGSELTSAELLTACSDGIATETAESLARILGAADQVKFNRRQPAPAEALGEWEAVRHWVDRFQLKMPLSSAAQRDPDSGAESGAEPAAGADRHPGSAPETRQGGGAAS
jgi:hypothetical protein